MLDEIRPTSWPMILAVIVLTLLTILVSVDENVNARS
jgi:hypothetical protein